jgi:hypothetical protein
MSLLIVHCKFSRQVLYFWVRQKFVHVDRQIMGLLLTLTTNIWLFRRDKQYILFCLWGRDKRVEIQNKLERLSPTKRILPHLVFSLSHDECFDKSFEGIFKMINFFRIFRILGSRLENFSSSSLSLLQKARPFLTHKFSFGSVKWSSFLQQRLWRSKKVLCYRHLV